MSPTALPPRLGVVYVQYARDPDPRVLATLRAYLARWWYCRPFLVVVDNLRPQAPPHAIQGGVVVGGDNADREFSGWDRGLAVLRAQAPDVECVLLVNDVFLAPGPSFLAHHPTIDQWLAWRDAPVAVGRIDRYPAPVTFEGRPLDGWLCTNAVLLPRPVVDALGAITTWREADLDRVVPRTCPAPWATTTRLVFGPGSETADGAVAAPGPAPILVTLEGDGPSRVTQLRVGDRTLADAVPQSGWRTQDDARWADALAGAVFHDVPAGAAVSVAVARPAWSRAREGRRHVVLRVAGDPFLPEAPLDAPYRAALLDWLFVRWRHRLVPGPAAWPALRNKLRAILNEASLSQRLQALGVTLTPYGPERYY